MGEYWSYNNMIYDFSSLDTIKCDAFFIKASASCNSRTFHIFIVQLKMLRKSSNFLLLQVVLLYTLESHTERKIYLNFLSILILQQKIEKWVGLRVFDDCIIF